jgi:3-phenylpropionate/cinnamic acid dioxygenase small subunit
MQSRVLAVAGTSDVARVADELAIRNVLAAVAQFADGGTVDEYVGRFTDDAVWQMPANPTIGLAESVRRGAADIRAGVEERRAAGVQGPGTHTRHVVGTVRVEHDGGDTATAYSYFTFWTGTATAPVARTVGAYEDTFRRTPAGWRLAHRIITMG